MWPAAPLPDPSLGAGWRHEGQLRTPIQGAIVLLYFVFFCVYVGPGAIPSQNRATSDTKAMQKLSKSYRKAIEKLCKSYAKAIEI